MLPRPEIDTLILTAQDAADLALEGKPADGYQALLGGLARAGDMEGEPWAKELVGHWEAAVERFANRWAGTLCVWAGVRTERCAAPSPRREPDHSL